MSVDTKKPSKWMAFTMGSQMVNAVAGMATNVLYARFLPLSDVGSIALINSISIFGAVFLDRGMGAWATRAMGSSSADFGTALRFLLRSAVPFAVGGFVLCIGAFFARDALGPHALFLIVSSAALCGAFWLFQLAISLTQGLNMPSTRAWAILLNGVLTAVVTFVLLAAGFGVTSCIIASGAVYLAIALSLIIRCRTSEQLEVENVSYRTSVHEAFPLFGANIVTYAVSTGDVLLSSLFLSAEQIGRYQVAKKIAQSISLPLVSILPMLLGRLARMPENYRWPAVKRLLLWSSIFFIVSAVSGAFVLPWFVPLLFGDEYRGLTVVTLGLMAAFSLLFFRDLLGTLSNANGFFMRALVANSMSAFVLCTFAFVLRGHLTLTNYSLVILVSYLCGVLVHGFWFLKHKGLSPSSAILPT